MATISLRRIANSESGAEAAVMDIAGDIANVEGVKTNITVVEDPKTGNYLAEMTIVVPPEAELDQVQKEKLKRFTDLDEKREELTDDFVAVKNPELANDQNQYQDLVAEAIEDDLASAATVTVQNELLVKYDVLQIDQVEYNDAQPEDEIIVNKSDIGEMIPDPAPEADAEFGVGLTAEVVEEREARQAEKEKHAANSPEEPSRKKKQAPDDEFKPAA